MILYTKHPPGFYPKTGGDAFLISVISNCDCYPYSIKVSGNGKNKGNKIR